MFFEWDENKNLQNLLKHNVRFETAVLVFDDPHGLTQSDPCEEEERWKTMGVIEKGVILVVSHTWSEQDNQELVRIISARIAESRERRIYEEAQQGTKTRNRRSRGYERRRY